MAPESRTLPPARSWIILGLAVVAFVVHLSVPLGHVACESDSIGCAGGSIERGDWADMGDASGDTLDAALIDTALAGVLVALIGSLCLVGVGFLATQAYVARWLSWGAGTVAVVGNAVAFYNAMLWTGLGWTSLLETVAGTEAFARLWPISAPIVAVLSGAGLVLLLKFLGEVTADSGVESSGRRSPIASARWAMLFLGLVIMMPWAIQVSHGGGEARIGPAAQDGVFFVSSYSVMDESIASNGEVYGALGYALQVMVATAFVGLAAGLLASMRSLLADHPATARAAVVPGYIGFATLFMLGWSVILYVLAWVYMWDPGFDFTTQFGFEVDVLPGFLPIVVAPVLIFWVLHEWRMAMAVRRHGGIRQVAAA